MPLHTTSYGDHGSRVVFCHGLFGQGKNWTQAAKSLSTDHRVLLLDMPNHGRSPWTEKFDYVELADMVAAQLEPSASYDGPVLWVAGETSHYVDDEYAPEMDRLFPRNRRVTIKGAGHWVHSEQPEVFLEVLRRFVD